MFGVYLAVCKIDSNVLFSLLSTIYLFLIPQKIFVAKLSCIYLEYKNLVKFILENKDIDKCKDFNNNRY